MSQQAGRSFGLGGLEAGVPQLGGHLAERPTDMARMLAEEVGDSLGAHLANDAELEHLDELSPTFVVADVVLLDAGPQ